MKKHFPENFREMETHFPEIFPEMDRAFPEAFPEVDRASPQGFPDTPGRGPTDCIPASQGPSHKRPTWGSPPQAYPRSTHIPALFPKFWCFLATLYGQAASLTQPGNTWLELMMLFVMRGGTLEPRGTPEQLQQPHPRPNILPAVQMFKRVVKEVLNLYGGPIAKCFFTPGKMGT